LNYKIFAKQSLYDLYLTNGKELTQESPEERDEKTYICMLGMCTPLQIEWKQAHRGQNCNGGVHSSSRMYTTIEIQTTIGLLLFCP